MPSWSWTHFLLVESAGTLFTPTENHVSNLGTKAGWCICEIRTTLGFGVTCHSRSRKGSQGGGNEDRKFGGKHWWYWIEGFACLIDWLLFEGLGRGQLDLYMVLNDGS